MNIDSMQCLVAGGCHVDGYPVGKTAGFADIAMKICAVSNDSVKVLGAIHLGHASKLVDACAHQRPHALVLQMGHFETTKPLTGASNSRSGSTSTSGSSRDSATQPALFRTRLQTLSWDVKNLIKLQLARVRGKTYFDASDVQRSLGAFCDEIAKLDLPRVILLSPLPCADRVSLGNRHKLLTHFESNAKRCNFDYLDVMSSLLAAARGKDIYYDAIHLNRKGHELLGQLVAQLLLGPPSPNHPMNHSVETPSVIRMRSASARNI